MCKILGIRCRPLSQLLIMLHNTVLPSPKMLSAGGDAQCKLGFLNWNGRKRALNRRPYLQFCIQQIKSKLFPFSNKELFEACNTFCTAYQKNKVSRKSDVDQICSQDDLTLGGARRVRVPGVAQSASGLSRARSKQCVFSEAAQLPRARGRAGWDRLGSGTDKLESAAVRLLHR